jgi:hypothetical protein
MDVEREKSAVAGDESGGHGKAALHFRRFNENHNAYRSLSRWSDSPF